MFGFGRPAREKAIVNVFASQLHALGVDSKEAVKNATTLIEEVSSELRARGIDPFKSTQGDDYATNAHFIEHRLAEGLNVADIKSHWNRPLLLVLGEARMRELFNFMIVDVARKQGTDMEAAAQNYKRNFPRYGDTEKWDVSDKYNEGLQQKDAEIYPEFGARVDAWHKKTSQPEVDRLIKEHGTMNAVIRHLVQIKAL